MNRRDCFRILGVAGVGMVAPTATAIAALLPKKPLEPFFASHPDFGKPNSRIEGRDFVDLAKTVDALVERVS